MEEGRGFREAIAPPNVSISNCVFIGNVASYDGGAIDVTGFGNTSPTISIVNSSFTGNNANGFVSASESVEDGDGLDKLV